MTVVALTGVRASRARLDQLTKDHPELITSRSKDAVEWERTLEDLGIGEDEDMAEAPVTYGLEEVAAIVGVHVETIRRAIRDGELKAAKLPRNYRVSRIELERWWEALGGGALFGAMDALTPSPKPEEDPSDNE